MLRPLLASSAVLLVALPARAERPNDAVTLEYLPSRATIALCPAANFLNLEVQIRLGYALFQPSALNHLTVKVDWTNGLFRSTDEMRDEDGNVTFARTYSEVDCTMAIIDMAIGVSIKFTRPGTPEPARSLSRARARVRRAYRNRAAQGRSSCLVSLAKALGHEPLLRARHSGEAALCERKDGGRRRCDVDVFPVVPAENRDHLRLEASAASLGIRCDPLAHPRWEADRVGSGGIGSREGLGGGHHKIDTISVPDGNGEWATAASAPSRRRCAAPQKTDLT